MIDSIAKNPFREARRDTSAQHQQMIELSSSLIDGVLEGREGSYTATLLPAEARQRHGLREQIFQVLERRMPWPLLLDDAFLKDLLFLMFANGLEDEALNDGWNKSLFGVVGLYDWFSVVDPLFAKEMKDRIDRLQMSKGAFLDIKMKLTEERFEAVLERILDPLPDDDQEHLQLAYEELRNDLRRLQNMKASPLLKDPALFCRLRKLSKGALLADPDHELLQELVESPVFRELAEELLMVVHDALRKLVVLRLQDPSQQLFVEFVLECPGALETRCEVFLALAERFQPMFMLKDRDHEADQHYVLATVVPDHHELESLHLTLEKVREELGHVLRVVSVRHSQKPYSSTLGQ